MSHDNMNIINCEICNHKYYNYKNYRQHLDESHHNRILATVTTCPFCNLQVSSPVLLNHHLLSCDAKLEREAGAHARAFLKEISSGGIDLIARAKSASDAKEELESVKSAKRELEIAKREAREAAEEIIELRRIAYDEGRTIVMKAGKPFGSK